MMPIIPHFANECYEQVGGSININWPEVNENVLTKKNTTYVIQINGKKRAVIDVHKDTDEDSVIKKLKDIENIQLPSDLSKAKKIIFVKNKILNIVV